MKKDVKTQSSLYSFLDPHKASGDAAAIDQIKKEHRKQYKANWKRQKRQTQKTVELFFDKQEWKVITKAAGKHHKSFTAYIKQAALNYCNKTYLIRDDIEYRQIREVLYMVHARLKNMEGDTVVSSQAINELQHIFTAVHASITQQLQYPKTLEETIIETIHANPAYKEIIQHILQNI